MFDKTQFIHYSDIAAELEKAGKPREAIEKLMEAVRFGAEKADVYFETGKLYRKLGDCGRSLKDLEKAQELDPQNGIVHVEKAWTYEKMGKRISAIDELKCALDKGYCGEEVYSNMGRIYKDMGEYGRSADELNRALDINPDNIALYKQLSEVFTKMSDIGSAIKILKICREKFPDEWDIYLSLGRIYRSNGDQVSAVDNFKKALSIKDLSEKEWMANRILNEIEFTGKEILLDSRPVSLTVVLTTWCNLACAMCTRIKNKPATLSFETVKSVYSLLPYIQAVDWQGGEVFILDYFRQLFKDVSEFPHIRQTITTNALLINREWAEILSESNIRLLFMDYT
ncbi:tetratricopeptide repeat protein, partial [Elusimicrobiota bacterium]